MLTRAIPMTSHVYTSKASRTLPNVIGTPAYLNDDNVGLKEELPEDDGSDAESDAEVYVSGEEDGVGRGCVRLGQLRL